MKIEFSIPLKEDCAGKDYFTFFSKDHKEFLSNIFELMILEKASRKNLENWQLYHLNNLFHFVREKSQFWRERIPEKQFESLKEISQIPVLSRIELKEQVEKEGCLLSGEESSISVHCTSGSSGIPMRFFVDDRNGTYNFHRNFASHLMTHFDLRQPIVKMWAHSELECPGFIVEEGEGVGSLGLIDTGPRRIIKYSNPDLQLLKKEIGKKEIGALVVNPYMMQTLLQVYNVDEMKRDGMTTWLPIGGAPQEWIREELAKKNISVKALYSSEEVATIGEECEKNPYHYHIMTSNVFIECEKDDSLSGNLGRILVTKIMARATPFIRYDIGDIGELLDKCPCGHDGPTLKNVHGRSKCLVKKKDGSVFPFLIQIKNHPFIANYKEYRFIQTDINTIRIQIGGISSITEEEVNQWAGVVYDQVGREEFQIEIEVLDQIDWGHSTKKIPFKSLVI